MIPLLSIVKYPQQAIKYYSNIAIKFGFMGIEQKDSIKPCLCEDPQCAKCLVVNCEDDNCKVHTMDNKLKRRSYYKKDMQNG